MRSPPFSPYRQGTETARASIRTAQCVTEFLQAHDKMASLLPTATRMAALQKDCATLLPDIFNDCAVLQFESDQLILSIPNAALASKLKQRLPKLQDALRQRGWQVSAIRLKVQIMNITEKSTLAKQSIMTPQAVSALAMLNHSLEETPRNAALKAAISTMIKRQSEIN
jgi:hypothetical protein